MSGPDVVYIPVPTRSRPAAVEIFIGSAFQRRTVKIYVADFIYAGRERKSVRKAHAIRQEFPGKEV